MSQAPSVRQRIAAANKRIARLKRIDRTATGTIVLGGIGVVASVMGILLFIAAEGMPLFRGARAQRVGVVTLSAGPTGGDAVAGAPLAFGVDEHMRYLYAVRPDARLALHRLEDGSFVRSLPLPGIAGATVLAASRSLQGDFVAAATRDGRVALGQVLFRPVYENERLADVEVSLRDRGTVTLDPAGRPLRAVTYGEQEGRKALAAIVADDEVLFWTTDDEGQEHRATLTGRLGEAFSAVALGRLEGLVAGTEKGSVFHWELEQEPRLTDVSPVSSERVTSLDWVLGGVSFVAGDARGGVSGWFRARLREEDSERPMLRAHDFHSQGAPVVAIAPSTRDKSFATFGSDGSIAFHYFSNARTILTLAGDGQAVSAALVNPKGDGLVAARADGSIARYAVQAPHPEVTWGALFGRLWYEGYSKAEYVWQSTGMSNDFETKFSLVPLIFGTIKGTFYALLFAIPLAVLGALYTSQFVHPVVKAKIKPTVEIMAALPSVVIGFIAGLWMASLFERHAVSVLLMLLVAPAAGTAGFLLWRVLPGRLQRRLKPGTEVALIVPLVIAGGWLATRLAPFVEGTLFGGDLRLWLSSVGLPYDQRNCLVVGIAMGFAVIPIIFTISEDSFSSVPSSLTAASLALGASRWQTAVRVVLPTASPGVFSAVMVGFGRAVGETMIVLMATGNTPVLDWSIFNGMRTLSANIAVEVPEAPHGGTLYRILFLSGAVLFAMTFVVNTVAELIRQRLRERYRAL